MSRESALKLVYAKESDETPEDAIKKLREMSHARRVVEHKRRKANQNDKDDRQYSEA